MLERMKQKRNEGGFTLIELLIVIIILAILAAIVVFAVGNTSQSAAKASCLSDAKSVETAIEAFKAQHPGPQNDSTADPMGYPANSGELLSSDTVDGATVGPWLKTWPGTADYQITFNTSGSVWVTGPNSSLTYNASGDIDVYPNQACNVAQAS
jgi:prepilin-type N-terminal cleavage/methylation domain-containing protein